MNVDAQSFRQAKAPGNPDGVWIVDDDRSIRDLLTAVLAREFQVTEADSGAALQRSFTEPQPDVVVLDVKLQDANGLELLPQIKKRWSDTEVIVLTGEGTMEMAMEAGRLGAYNFLAKPFENEKLLTDVKCALERKQQNQENSALRRALVSAIPSLVARLDANLPIANLRTMDDQIWDNTARDRVLSTLSTAFAVLATVLAAIGLYAVLAYGVSQRLREFGIRIALGAKGADVRRLVLGHVTRIALIGSAVGAALAFGMGRLAGTMLIGVDGYDATVIAGAAMLAVIVALLAGALPARRASAVNPIEALRAD